MKIPIENVYYLLCYAWDHVQERDLVDASGTPADRPADLFGHVLAEATGRVLRRGLDRGYVERSEEVPGVRGKLELSTTLKRNLTAQGRTHCRFEELRHDIRHNQILKSTLRNLAQVDDLDSGLRGRLVQLHRRFEDVSEVELSRRQFRSVQIHRNNQSYDFLLKLCLLIHESLLVEEAIGTTRFHDFRRDEATMWKVFEDFVYNFYRREQTTYRVSRPYIQWSDARGSDEALRHLPIMRTDVFLESRNRRIILDCKYSSRPLTEGRFGDERVKTANLYQIFAYVINRIANEGQSPPHEGVLLYPAVSREFNFEYRLMGHPITVKSIDLGQPWLGIREDMLAAVA